MLARSLTNARESGEVRNIGIVEIRPRELQVLVDGERAGFTVREFEIFYVLAERHDRVVPREEIYQLVWGGTMPRRDRSVDVFVRKVRGKLATVAPEWNFIHTHFGIGYRFKPEASIASSA
jgi:DNA-binding response OmpR family regulator